MFGSIAVTVTVKKDSGDEPEKFPDNAASNSEPQIINIDGSVFRGQRRAYSSNASSNSNSQDEDPIKALVDEAYTCENSKEYAEKVTKFFDGLPDKETCDAANTKAIELLQDQSTKVTRVEGEDRDHDSILDIFEEARMESKHYLETRSNSSNSDENDQDNNSNSDSDHNEDSDSDDGMDID